MKVNRWNRVVRCLIATAFVTTNIVYANPAERNFWTSRSKAAQSQQSDDLQVASLPTALRTPITGDATSLMRHLTQANTPSAATTSIKKTLPSSLSRSHGALFESLSANLGSLRRAVLPPGKIPTRAVVLIQDIHLNNEAQTNISQALRRLSTVGGVDLIALEGAWKELNTHWFRRFPDRRAVDLVSNYLLKENRITAGGHAALLAPVSFAPVVGIDDASHYQANVEAYRKAAGSMKSDGEKIAGFRKMLAGQKAARFNPALAAFDRSVEEYRDGKSPLTAYVKAMAQNGTPTAAVKQFLAALSMEEKLDFAKIEKERDLILQRLIGRLSAAETAELTQRSLDHRAGVLRYGDFYAFLKDLCAKKGVDLATAPTLESYIRYVSAAEQIDVDRLFEDLNALERQGYKTLAQTPQERQLAEEGRWGMLAAKLVDFSLTTEEWGEFKTLETDRPGWIDLTSYKQFYVEADIRDNAMAANFVNEMDKRRAHTGVLVAGGFHTPGLTRKLNQAGIAVVTFVPKVSHADLAKGGETLSIFNQEQTPLNKLFLGDRLFLSYMPLDERTAGLAREMTAHVSRTKPGLTSTMSYEGETITMTEKGETLIVAPKTPDVTARLKNMVATVTLAFFAFFSQAPDTTAASLGGDSVVEVGAVFPSPYGPYQVMWVGQRSNPTSITIQNTQTHVIQSFPSNDRLGSDVFFTSDGRFAFILGGSATGVIDLRQLSLQVLPVMDWKKAPSVQVEEASDRYTIRDGNGTTEYQLDKTGRIIPQSTGVDGTFRGPVELRTTPNGKYNVFIELQRGNSQLTIEDVQIGEKRSPGVHPQGALLVTDNRAVFLNSVGQLSITYVDLATLDVHTHPFPLPKIAGVEQKAWVVNTVGDQTYSIQGQPREDVTPQESAQTNISYNIQTGVFLLGEPLSLTEGTIPSGALLSPVGNWAARRSNGVAVDFFDGTTGAVITSVQLPVTSEELDRASVLAATPHAMAVSLPTSKKILLIYDIRGEIKTVVLEGGFVAGRFLGPDSLPLLVLKQSNGDVFYVDLAKESAMSILPAIVPNGASQWPHGIQDLLGDIGTSVQEIAERLGNRDAFELNRFTSGDSLPRSVLPLVTDLLNSLDGPGGLSEQDWTQRILENTEKAYQTSLVRSLKQLMASMDVETVQILSVNTGDESEIAAMKAYLAYVTLVSKIRGTEVHAVVVPTSQEAQKALSPDLFPNTPSIAFLRPELSDAGLSVDELAKKLADQLKKWNIDPKSAGLHAVSRMMNIQLSPVEPPEGFLKEVQETVQMAKFLPALTHLTGEIDVLIKVLEKVAQMA